jgi:hypothetical protein
MLYRFTAIGFPALFLYGTFVFAAIHGFTSLMDRTPSAGWIEAARGVAGAAYVVWAGGWFGIGGLIPAGDVLVAAYFVATAAGGLYFARLPAAVDSGALAQQAG